mgnify:CR=1 FL=1
MTQKRNFLIALLLWFFLFGLGLHRIYIQEKIHYIFWYWIAVTCTLGIVLLVDLFLIKSMIEKQYELEETNRKIRAL